MMPKIIHYCWFGGKPLTPLAVKCIESWKKKFPPYEIKEWNEDNFDVYAIPYIREAYEQKKYAFVSDYARFFILYKYGGIYLDVDVEVINPFQDIIDRGAFMACESNYPLALSVNPGLGCGCEPGNEVFRDFLELYATLHFDGQGGTKTICHYTTEYFVANGLQNSNQLQQVKGIWIYPKDYFCPKNPQTKQCNFTENTRTIHHYAASWFTWSSYAAIFIRKFLGERGVRFFARIKHLIKF